MVSTKGRYALRIMLDLAAQPPETFISLKSIAERQEISMKYLEMIVSLLCKNGLLQSSRGKTGGYRLTHPADSITVSAVLAATEGSMAPVACLDCKDPCKRAALCLTLPMWQHLDRITTDYLSGITVQDLLDGKVQ